MSEIELSWDTVLKLGAFGVCVMIVLQLIFYFIFQLIGYDSFWLGIILIASVLIFIIILVSFRILKKTIVEQTS